MVFALIEGTKPFFEGTVNDLKQVKIYRKLFLFFCIVLVFSVIYRVFTNKDDWIMDNRINFNYATMFHFSLVTGSTVGFGDVYPLSTRARVFTDLEILCTFIVLIS